MRATGEFIGFAGLDDMDEGMPFDGVEIGRRLARSAWGRDHTHPGPAGSTGPRLRHPRVSPGG
ncbi:hypothetical protein GCM10010129_68780 [Streptomyces fumigatiscleroticus]|nr:hypothetical protein GCM10010129_68780 [Streptomyces fumigatiscleroticus]